MERISRALVVAVLVLSLTVGVAAAETRSGGSVVIEEGETVDDDLQAFGGTVVVRGTVNGDLEAFGGSVVVTGTVNGDVNAFAGSVRIAGEVTGDVGVAGGDVLVEEGAAIGGGLDAAGSTVTLEGTVEGDATLGAESLALGQNARIGGNLEYDADSTNFAEGAVVAGSVEQVDAVGTGPMTVPQTPDWLGGIYGFLVNLVVGAILIAALPAFSAGVARRATEDPLPAGGVGLLVLIGVPILLVLVAITIIGIPVALVGFLVWGLGLWFGFVYGAYALGTWVYAAVADEPSRWVALLVGLVIVTVAGLIPVLGGLFNFLVLLLGLGALGMAIWAGFEGQRRQPAAAPEETREPASD